MPFDPLPPLREIAVIEAVAVAWLAEREAGFTGEAAAAFADWRAADARHEAAVLRLEGRRREAAAVRRPWNQQVRVMLTLLVATCFAALLWMQL